MDMYHSMYEVDSARVRGAVIQSLERKRELKQAPPLTVKAVEALEEAIFDKKLNRTQRIIAGFARFCVGARQRHSDAARLPAEPTL